MGQELTKVRGKPLAQAGGGRQSRWSVRRAVTPTSLASAFRKVETGQSARIPNYSPWVGLSGVSGGWLLSHWVAIPWFSFGTGSLGVILASLAVILWVITLLGLLLADRVIQNGVSRVPTKKDS